MASESASQPPSTRPGARFQAAKVARVSRRPRTSTRSVASTPLLSAAMPSVTNGEIAAAFDELADLYELDGAVVHRVLAYRTAAKTVREAPRSVAELARAGRATELPGIGRTLEEKIGALIETGTIPATEKLRAKYPPGLVAITHLPGLGPKRVRRLFDELGVDSPEALRAAAESGRIRKLRGFGEKAEAAILEALAQEDAGESRSRMLLSRALAVGEDVVAALRARGGPEARVELAGSARRWADSVKDLDIIAAAPDPAALAAALGELDLVERLSSSEENAARATTHSGLKIDLRVVDDDQFGNLLQHFTGSKAHNVQLREAAVRRGLHVSEYGIDDESTGETQRCATEEEVYARLGMAWIPPELREGRGELEAAERDELPDLVTLDDLRGELHCHTVLSDGRGTLEEMVEAARARGLEYLAITDHSASHGFGNHVDAEELWRQIERVHELNDRLDDIEVLAGSEVNIGLDGSLDYPDDLLAALDWVIASVHTSFGMGSDQMTARMIAAMEHPSVDAIGHPTGRKIETRGPYALDVEAVIDAAARTRTMLEINAAPDRRDLNDLHARAAAAAGVPILVNTDAHSPRNFALVRYGIATARRAWLTADDVANTRPWPAFASLRKRVRVTPDA
jgi:DNA polymerase (family X)